MELVILTLGMPDAVALQELIENYAALIQGKPYHNDLSDHEYSLLNYLKDKIDEAQEAQMTSEDTGFDAWMEHLDDQLNERFYGRLRQRTADVLVSEHSWFDDYMNGMTPEQATSEFLRVQELAGWLK